MLYPYPGPLHPGEVPTFSVVDAVALFSEAAMVVEPAATPDARPSEFIVAMAGFEADQVAKEVISSVVPLLSCSVAVNCCVAPIAMLPGITEIAMVPTEGGVAATTFSVTVAVIPFSEAVMIVDPALTPVATPDGATVAIAAFDVVQAAVEVITDVVPSLYVAFAANAWTVPTATLAGFGEIVMDCSVADVAATATVTDAVFAVTPPIEAEIVADPATTPVAVPPAMTVTIAGLEETHVAVEVTSEEDPSV